MSKRRRPDPADVVDLPDLVVTPIDENAVRVEVERLAGGLAGATDEATGDALDRLIDTWTIKWTAQVDAEHAAHLVVIEHALGIANAELSALDVECDRERTRASEINRARDAAVESLSPHRTPEQENDQPPSTTKFHDPPLLAGRPWKTWIHLLVLALAAGADISSFIGVIELLMPTQQWPFISVLVTGLTAVSLYLAHLAGTVLRDRKADDRAGGRIRATLSLAAWAGVGGLAAWARLTAPPPLSTSSSWHLGQAVGSANSSSTSTTTGAAVFLALYIAGGLVAALGSYKSHNPFYDGFRTAVRAGEKASKQVQDATLRHGVATTTWTDCQNARTKAEKTRKSEQAKRIALGAEMKQYARVLFAAQARDPALTDAIFNFENDHYSGNGHDARNSNGGTR